MDVPAESADGGAPMTPLSTGELQAAREEAAVRRPLLARFPAMLWGVLLLGLGLSTYVLGALLAATRYLTDRWLPVTEISRFIVWYCGMPVAAGILLIVVEIVVLLPRKRRLTEPPFEPVSDPSLTVVLTAFNDEQSIGDAVRDFTAHPRVRRVIVVDNNSRDATARRAAEAGAAVVVHKAPGYGQCVYRALTEGLAFEDTGLTLLCEGDRTFRASDIEKFLAYAPHAEIVNGTRIVEQLRSPRTQLTALMYYGNFIVGKLLELKHIGRGTLTDVGTTYKLVRNNALARLLPHLNPGVNLEFNAHLLDTALGLGITVVECPVTFHPRVGESKGGNRSNWRAAAVGSRMMLGILFGWKRRTA